MIRKTYDYTGWTAVDIAERFGPIPISRICMEPAPGHAKEEDVVELHDRTDRLFELVDGTLVEKVMGTYEAYLATRVSTILSMFVMQHRLGIVLGADGMMRFSPGLIRIPDVSFISKNRIPEGLDPNESVATVIPNLAVEVISQSNSDREMQNKLEEFFHFGVELVWYVYPQAKSVHVFTSPTEHKIESTKLDGGKVLPDFEMSIKDLFAKPF